MNRADIVALLGALLIPFEVLAGIELDKQQYFMAAAIIGVTMLISYIYTRFFWHRVKTVEN